MEEIKMAKSIQTEAALIAKREGMDAARGNTFTGYRPTRFRVKHKDPKWVRRAGKLLLRKEEY
jgi:hypothetical protein